MDEKSACSECGKELQSTYTKGAEILGLSKPKVQQLCWECGLKSIGSEE
jgi:hypothetical protein